MAKTPSNANPGGPPHGPFGDVRPPVTGPVKDFPTGPLKLGYQLYDEGTKKWVSYDNLPPPAKFFGYFEYEGYWLHYDPLGTGPGGARPGQYLFQGFYAGWAYPPDGIPPYGWDPPPKPRSRAKPKGG